MPIIWQGLVVFKKTVNKKTVNMKNYLWAGLIIGACCAAPTASQAQLSYVGTGYVELSTSQTSPVYTSVPDGGTGANLGLLATITQGDSLFLGGQIQTFPVANGNATLYYEIVGINVWQTVNLAYSQSNVGNNSDNNVWDSSGGNNGFNNQNNTYYSVDISSGLSSGNNTVNFYFSATDTDTGGNTLTDGSSGTPYSFNVNVVPEPITLALPIFGGLVLTAGLARRFITRRAGSIV